MNVKKGKPNIKNNKGFTLIEVLLAIVILSLVSAPILRGFVVTANTSARARKIMEATDVAQLVVEEISAMTFDKEFTDTLLKTTSTERISSVNYTAEGETLALDDGNFLVYVRDHAADDKKCYINGTAGAGGFKLLAIPNVEYDGKKYDVMIGYRSNSTGGSEKYYTYDIRVQVYDQESGSDEYGNPTYSHFRNQLVELSTQISNKY